MKHLLPVILLFLLALPLCSFDSYSLVGHPMPLLPAKTLDGKTVDAHYFEGHVTVVVFMAFGCIPCMYEINVLNKISDEYAAKGVQVLCIARQMCDQVMQFNSEDKKSYFYMLRNAMKAEPMRYAVQPACADKQSTMQVSEDGNGSKNITLKVECNTLEETYGVTGVPVTFYVDKNGIIRKTAGGGPGKPNDPDYYKKVKNEIDQMLGEKGAAGAEKAR
jgi:thiol-disulfide isomerase/thioredoxin